MNRCKFTGKPRTLEQSFYMLKNIANRKFNETEIRVLIFEYASRIVEIEGVNTSIPENNGYLEFLMKNFLGEFVDREVEASCKAKRYNLSIKTPSLERAVSTYIAHPLYKGHLNLYQRGKTRTRKPLKNQTTSSF